MITMQPAYPFRFLLAPTLLLLAAASPEPGVCQRASPSSVAEWAALAAPYGWQGALLVTRGLGVEASYAAGLAAPGRGTPITTRTLFDIGSITKQFTAVAILALAEDGRLSLSDSLGRYFPGVPGDKAGITLHHLLTHTAGIELELNDAAQISRDSLVRLYLAAGRESATGEFSYSNAGYSILAAVVERAAAMPYERFLQERLFRPAGMEDTGMVLPTWSMARVAHGIVDGEDLGTPMQADAWLPDGPSWSLRGAGGMLSTVEDLVRWTRALEGGKVLSPASLQVATSTQVSLPPNPLGYTGLGYTWFIGADSVGTVRARDGANRVFYVEIRRYPAQDLTVVYATNSAGAGSYRGEEVIRGVARTVAAVALGRSVRKPPAGARPATRALALEVEGLYRLPSGGSLRVTADGPLVVEAEGQDAVELLVEADTVDVAAARAASSLSALLLDNLARGDSATLRRAAGNSSARVAQAIGRHRAAGERGLGAFRESVVLGTVRSWWSGDGTLGTFVRMEFERGSRVMRLHWRDGALVAVGGAAILSPARIAFAPVSAGRLAGFHPALPVRAPIDVERRAGHVVAIRVAGIRAARHDAVRASSAIGSSFALTNDTDR